MYLLLCIASSLLVIPHVVLGSGSSPLVIDSPIFDTFKSREFIVNRKSAVFDSSLEDDDGLNIGLYDNVLCVAEFDQIITAIESKKMWAMKSEYV